MNPGFNVLVLSGLGDLGRGTSSSTQAPYAPISPYQVRALAVDGINDLGTPLQDLLSSPWVPLAIAGAVAYWLMRHN